ncbi:MAG: hypothetical protein V2B15_10790 [Bacteroidota bacterium]
MFRRFIYVGLFVVVCAGLLSVILLKRMDKITPVEELQAIPGDALLFIEDIDYAYMTGTFLPASRIWVDFINTSGKNRLDSMISGMISRIHAQEDIQDLLLKEGFGMSLHLQGKEQLMPLFYVSYAGHHTDHEFEQMVFSLLDDKTMVNDRKYETEVLYDVSGNPESTPGKFTFTCVNGLCLISPSAMLVEESVRTIHSDVNLSEDNGLQLIRGTAGRYVHANIYINYSRIHLLGYPIIKQDEWRLLEELSELASWGELDLDIKEDAVVLNGMTLAKREEPLILGTLANQSPVKIELHEMMPSGTLYFLHLGISDKPEFRTRMEDYLTAKGEWAGVKAATENLMKRYGIDPLDDIFALMDDEMAWFAIEGETGRTEDEVVMIETKSQSETTEVVLRWIEQYLQVNSFDMQVYRNVYRLDNQTSFQIYKMPEAFFDGLLPGKLFNKYFTVYENCLIFGPSVDVLSRVIYQNVLHKTFVSDPVFKEMSDYLSNRSNVTLFFRPFAYMKYKEEILNKRATLHMKATELFLRRIPGIVVQYSSEEKLLYHSISCKYASQIKEKAMTVWESLMDSTAVIKPALVINHNTQEKEIFVQDAFNKIYLINSTGRILWERKLEEPVMGGVYQVDFYKNGRLQYLFNTADQLHLIDRNGNYVERYPVSLRAAATAPLALFDYDNSRDYRIFLASEDRQIYVYNIESNLVSGWKFGRSESIVTKAPQHFRLSDKDYIVFSDQNRSYFLDRQGKERVKPKQRVVFSPGNCFFLDMNIREEKPRWISTDTAGNVMCVYLDGSVTKLFEHDASAGHFFRMQDMNADGIPDFVFADGNELTVLNQEGKRLFSYKVRDRISIMPDIYKFSSSDIKIGLTDRSRNKIYLINSDGSLYEGFPLEGSTQFSIGYFAGSDSRFNLIVGSANNFLYNYSIE